jgi:hypothetical protein
MHGELRGRDGGTHLFDGIKAQGGNGPRPSRFVTSRVRQQPWRTWSDLQHGTIRDSAIAEIAPQRDDQLACHRHQHDPAHASLRRTEPSVEPVCERTARLVAQPKPGELDGGASCPRVARFGNTLIAPDLAAAPRARCQADIVYKSTLDLSDVSDGMDHKQPVPLSLGALPTSSPASAPPRIAASGLDFGNAPRVGLGCH